MERWQQIEKILDQVLDLKEPERTRYIEEQIGDEDLKAEIRSLLQAELHAPAWIDTGVDRLLGTGGHIHEIADSVKEQHIEIDRYRIVKEIGRGGMSVVYLAERTDGEFDQQVAVKIIQPFGLDRDDRFRRLRAERQILASLKHPNIARVFDGGITPEGWPYMVMEWVEGTPITTYCNEKNLGINARLQLFLKVCDAVTYAHRNLVVHRDLKPGNILVTESGEVKLLDFGIAKLLEEDKDAAPLTQTGLPLMTPEYAAPEQFKGETVTTSVDVYSLGVLLYELLAGERPYALSGKSTAEMERLICEEEPPKPSEASARPVGFALDRTKNFLTGSNPSYGKPDGSPVPDQLRGDLDVICMKALRKEPDERYGSVQELVEEIRRYLTGLPVTARPATTGYRIRKFIRRHRTGVTVAAVFVLMLAGFITVLIHQQTITLQERDRAQEESRKAREVSDFLLNLFEAGNPAESPDEPVTALSLLAHGVERAESLSDQPEVQVEMLFTIGKAYHGLGELELALKLFERTHETANRVFGTRSAEAASILAHIGWIHLQFGDGTEAEASFREAAEILTEILGPDHPEVANSLNGLALAMTGTGRFDEAAAILRRSLRILTQALGPRHVDIANGLYNLAIVLIAVDDLDEAEPFARQALEMRRTLLGKNHPDVGKSLKQVGSLLRRKGDFAGAEAHFLEALVMWNTILGDEHPYTHEIVAYLADLYDTWNKPDKAAEYRNLLVNRQ